MKLLAAVVLIALSALLPPTASAAIQREGENVALSGEGYSLVVSAANGSIVGLRQAGNEGSLLRSGEAGLWEARFRDGSGARAADFRAGSADHAFSLTADDAANALRLEYRGPEIGVAVTLTGQAGFVEMQAQVTSRGKTVLSLALPARLRFEADQVTRFVSPMSGGQSVGAAFNGRFFKLQPQDKPSGWSAGPGGAQGYITLYGAGLDQRADQDPPVALQATAEAREWFSPELIARINGAKAVVNRPPTRAQADLVLADSANGPYFSANHLKGSGWLWRLGGGVGEAEMRNAADMVLAATEKLAAAAPTGRTKLGLLALTRGPERGGWADVPVTEWLDRLRRSRAVTSGKLQVVELTSLGAMMQALNAGDFMTILNPYGEQTPVPEAGGMAATVAAVGRFVRAGGSWFEVGGYPFFYALHPSRYLSYGASYPDAFADFQHLDTAVGSASVYGVQPQKWGPWEGAKNKVAIFVPGGLACGGDEQGGYCERAFGTFVNAGETWRAPLVRLAVGKTAPEDLAEYCRANEIKRRLEDKMSPEALDKFKRAVLVYFGGNCREKTENLHLLPTPTFIHFAEYLKDGFDKQYPDHLPPNPGFGTPQEFRAFFDRAHELGHLVMPYTNPTWWCDHPQGPTFEREGFEPLLKNLDGKPSYERYAQNDGWTVCHWHPTVRAANRKTVREFTDEYPVDVLFQDQCGARGWQYDANPASPTPYAYSDGLVSMVAEDCKTKPLSTECGWDRVVNYESQLCGMTWQIVPNEGGPSWQRALKYEYPPETWEVFPLAQYIAHDKTEMVHHDLGQFVTSRPMLTWTLGLGFGLSYSLGAAALQKDAPREWLNWLDRLQKSVCARYVGEPVVAFEHDRGATPTMEDDGIIRATYGPVKIVANLGPTAKTEGGHELAPFGFYASAPGMVAANVKGGADDVEGAGVSYVVESKGGKLEAWVYGPPNQDVRVMLPDVGRSVAVRTPGRPGEKRLEPPAALSGKAPRDWPGAKPAVGVLDFPGVGMAWSRIAPADWVQALEKSRIATEGGVPVRRISTVEGLVAALQSGPTAWLAIINPYGEGFPETAPGKWREMLDMIRQYVNNGGCWWEIAGYSLYHAFAPVAGGWQTDTIGPSGMGYMGLPVGGGEVEQPAEALTVTPEGRAWLGKDLSATVGKAVSVVNRGLVRSSEDPGHVPLIGTPGQDFIGGYRLEGWGWLWRIGGFWPNPDVALPVTLAGLDYIYTHPPLPVKTGGVKYLWHVALGGN